MLSSNKGFVKEGDLIMLYESFEKVHILKIKSGSVFIHRFGKFNHSDLIGKQFGTSVYAATGFLWLLPPSPDRWVFALTHRTQIMYAMDISFVILKMNLKAGFYVAEAGTGSGCLTTAMATVVGKTGKILTFEFNDVRAQKAREDFVVIGLDEVVTVTHRDVCKDGLLLPLSTESSTSTSTTNKGVRISEEELRIPTRHSSSATTTPTNYSTKVNNNNNN
eukprot:c12594_g1_i1.p1 GENE.c12594_g1_i1~~c12594_g1_i1.p1  ORF type:complete len:232 (+),score=111.25 c12594_g1_i1:37-696(+)